MTCCVHHCHIMYVPYALFVKYVYYRHRLIFVLTRHIAVCANLLQAFARRKDYSVSTISNSKSLATSTKRLKLSPH